MTEGPPVEGPGLVTEAEPVLGMVEVGIVLPVGDMERAKTFYCDFLSFEFLRDEEDAGEDLQRATLRYGNVLVELVASGSPQPSSGFRMFWTVDSINDAVDLILAGGGKVIRRMEYGVYCADPDGHKILVRQDQPRDEEHYW